MSVWQSEECFPSTLSTRILFSICQQVLNLCISILVCGRTMMVLYRHRGKLREVSAATMMIFGCWRQKGILFPSRAADKPPRAPRFTPPTLEEVQSYVSERHSAVDPQGFIDFYTAKGWLVGKSPMKDWRAACRNAESWERWAKHPNSNRIRTSDEYAKEADFFG